MICSSQKRRKPPPSETCRYRTKREDDRPPSPTRMNRDIVWHVLYDTDMELIRDITLPAARRAEESSSGSSEIVNFVLHCRNLTAMRALFFIVLNVDEELREDVCSAEFCKQVWTHHGRPVPLCPYKATRFFQDMEESCIHRWMRNEQCTAASLVDTLIALYLCS